VNYLHYLIPTNFSRDNFFIEEFKWRLTWYLSTKSRLITLDLRTSNLEVHQAKLSITVTYLYRPSTFIWGAINQRWSQHQNIPFSRVRFAAPDVRRSYRVAVKWLSAR
jgi:hypothetical protein